MSGSAAKTSAVQGSVEQALAELRRDFCRGLEERICRIEAARVSLGTDAQGAAKALNVISAEAHRISGVAGSLGLASVGNMARDLETAVEGLPKGALPAARAAELDRQVERLLDLLEEHLVDD